MTQKRVTFEVAKALKDAGYPQNENDERKMRGLPEQLDIPTYLDVWLWLWKEKRIYINVFPDNDGAKISVWNADLYEIYEEKICYKSPEESIESAIKYIVDNGLLK